MDLLYFNNQINLKNRSSIEKIEKQKAYFSEFTMMTKVLDTLPNIVLILNKEREIVYANKNLFNENQKKYEVFGMRPGDLLNCVHSFENPDGCGTGLHCSMCGALKSVRLSQNQIPNVNECRISLNNSGGALDLRIWTNPIELNNEQFTVLVIEDISAEKRRGVLERIFFHDILNTAGSIKYSLQNLTKSNRR